eukprot:UN01416
MQRRCFMQMAPKGEGFYNSISKDRASQCLPWGFYEGPEKYFLGLSAQARGHFVILPKNGWIGANWGRITNDDYAIKPKALRSGEELKEFEAIEKCESELKEGFIAVYKLISSCFYTEPDKNKDTIADDHKIHECSHF